MLQHTEHEPVEGAGPSMISTGMAAAQPRKGPSAQTIVLGLVLVGSAAAVFGMRHFGLGPAGAIAASVEIDYKVGEGGAAAQAGYDQVLEALDRSGRPLQITADRITQDPFVLHDLLPDEEVIADGGEIDPGAAAARLLREREAKRQRELRAAFEALELQSVIGGRVPVARIGPHIVRVGDPVGDFFVVESISGRSVVLTTDDGYRFTLGMNENDLGDAMSVTRVPPGGEDD